MKTIPFPGKARETETIISGELINRTLYIDASRLVECARLWESGHYTQLGISSYENPDLDSLEFLRDFPAITSLHLYLKHKVDLTPLEAHADSLLRFFSNDDINGIRHIKLLPKLVQLGQRWSPDMQFEESLPCLQKLALTGFRPNSEDLSELPLAPALKSLSLYKPGIASLTGLERYTQLASLSIDSASKLVDVSALKSSKFLASVSFERCRKIVDFAGAIQQTEVENLRYVACAALPSVQFVARMPALKKIVFLETDVTDDDMTPLIDHPGLSYGAGM